MSNPPRDDAPGQAPEAAPETSAPQASPRWGVFAVVGGPQTGLVLRIPPGDTITLGRSPQCDVHFDESNLSRHHAQLSRAGDDHLLNDAGSKNGTFVNGVRIHEATALRDGDQVQLGTTTKLRFALVDEAGEQALRDVHRSRRRETMTAYTELPNQDTERVLELQQAQDFQRRLLRTDALPRLPGVDIEVVYEPLAMVGGDFYRITSPRDGMLRVFLFDATGRGVQGLLGTVPIASEYEALKDEPIHPGQLLDTLNQRLISHRAAVCCSAVCLDLDLGEGTMRVASAAHPPAFLLRDGELLGLGSDAALLGQTPEASFPEASHPLRRGDSVVLYTNGATDTRNPSGEPFGDERLKSALLEAHSRSIALATHARHRLQLFNGGQPFDDDLTLLAVRWVG